MIFQNEDMLIVVSEHINDGYRIVYINGKHPDDIWLIRSGTEIRWAIGRAIPSLWIPLA